VTDAYSGRCGGDQPCQSFEEPESELLMSLSTAVPAIGAAFAASLVEFVEAFTIVLAVATLNGWRPTAMGALSATLLLGLAVLALGPLLSLVPPQPLQLTVGILLLLFGMAWLRKAILRSAGIVPLHDEDAIFAAERAQLVSEEARRTTSRNWIAGIAAFKAVLLEGLEVVFIVIAVGAGRGLLAWASLGALVAFIAVLVAGVILYRPLSRVPENALKFGVGVMLTSFGVFWTGEGLGIGWPGQDLVLPAFVALFLATGLVMASWLRQAIHPEAR